MAMAPIYEDLRISVIKMTLNELSENIWISFIAVDSRQCSDKTY